MSKEVYSDEKSRENVIKDMYVPLFDVDDSLKGEDSYVSYCKKYNLSDDENGKEEHSYTSKEKIYRWYVPTIDKDMLDEFLGDFDYTIEELYDDPFMLYKVVDCEEDN